MKNPITTKDLGLLNELSKYEQWAATKFRHWYDFVDDPNIQKLFQEFTLEHNARFDALYQYLKTNANAGGKQ